MTKLYFRILLESVVHGTRRRAAERQNTVLGEEAFQPVTDYIEIQRHSSSVVVAPRSGLSGNECCTAVHTESSCACAALQVRPEEEDEEEGFIIILGQG